ncbi:MAG TPA: NUDIX domain-containing protein [Candidatus Saccharimonadales bacterium]|nr:NUDIX domain-containing protein [Candidatus Saccharimonadales bacterium]
MNDDTPIMQVAAKAILVNQDGKILILREASTYDEGTNAGKYHGSVGGRINPTESYSEGLKREVEEEAGITDFEPLYPVYVGEWSPVIKGSKKHIFGIFTVCRTKSTKVKLSDEHDEYKWISLDEVDKYDILDGDRAAIEAYVKHPLTA